MIFKWSKHDIVKDLEHVRDGEMNLQIKEVKLVTMNLQNQ